MPVNEHSLATLISGQTYFADPVKDFNDPYDCLVAPVLRGTNRQVYEFWKGKGLDNPGLREEAETNPEGEYIQRKSSEDFAKLLVLANGTRIGIWCTSVVRDSILMFSHYGAGHQGISIGFDTSVFSSALRSSFREVKYRQDYAELNLISVTHPEDLTVLLTTKSSHWEYEKEWRAINNDTGSGVFEIPDSAIVELILGSRVSTSNKQMLSRVAAFRKVDLYQSSLSESSYGLQIGLVARHRV